MDGKSEGDESEEERERKPSSKTKKLANPNTISEGTKIPILSKADELTGIKFEVDLNQYNDNYVFKHVPDVTNPDYDPRRHFSYRFNHSPPRSPDVETRKKDRFKIVLNENGTFSCIDEAAKYDLSFETRYPNYFGDDFQFINYPPTIDDYPREQSCYTTDVKGDSTESTGNVFQFTPWRERAERAGGVTTPIERTTIHLSDLDIIDDDEPHTLLDEKDNETFYNEHFTRLLETGPLDQENTTQISKPLSPTNDTAEEDDQIEEVHSGNASIKSESNISLAGSDTSDEYNEIVKMLKDVTMETVYQTSNPLTKFRTVEEFVESENILQKEFKKQFKRPDKFQWYTFNYGEKVETPPPREQIHLFFDPEFRKWADPPPPSECSDEDEGEDHPIIYQDCEAEDHCPNPRPAYWIDFDAMREIGRPVAIYHARDFMVYNTSVKPLWIDQDFDFEAPIAPHFVEFDDFVYERNPSEASSDIYDPEESDIDEPPADACDCALRLDSPEMSNIQEMPRDMYQTGTHAIPQNYYPVQGYSAQPYQNVPQNNQRYYSLPRYPIQYNVQQMYNQQEMYRANQYAPQANPMYYPVQRYPVQCVPDMYYYSQEMYRGTQYVQQTNPMYYQMQRYPVQYNVPQMYNIQEMYRPQQNVQYSPRYYSYQRVPVQYNIQEMYYSEERYNTNQNILQTSSPPVQNYPTQYDILETNDNIHQQQEIDGGQRIDEMQETNIEEEMNARQVMNYEQEIDDNGSEKTEYSQTSPAEDINASDETSLNDNEEIEEMDQKVTPNNLKSYPLQRCPVHNDVTEINDSDEDNEIDDNLCEIDETSQSSLIKDSYELEFSTIDTEIEETDQNIIDIAESNQSPTRDSVASEMSMITSYDMDEVDQIATYSTEDEEYLTPAESPISTKCQTPQDRETTDVLVPELVIERYESKLRSLVSPEFPIDTPEDNFELPCPPSPTNIENSAVKTEKDNTTETDKLVGSVYWRSSAKTKKMNTKSDKRSNTSNASASTNVKNLKLLFKESEKPKKTSEKNVSKPVTTKKTQSQPLLSDSKNVESTSSPSGKQVKRANTEPWLSDKKRGKAAKSGKVGNKSKGNKNTNTQKVKQQKFQKSKNG